MQERVQSCLNEGDSRACLVEISHSGNQGAYVTDSLAFGNVHAEGQVVDNELPQADRAESLDASPGARNLIDPEWSVFELAVDLLDPLAEAEDLSAAFLFPQGVISQTVGRA